MERRYSIRLGLCSPAMARLVTASCPRCGALVPVEPDSDRATCTYCGAVAIVAAAAPAPVPVPRAPSGSGSAAGIVVGLAVLGVVVVGMGAGALMFVRSAPPAPQSPSSVSAPPIPAMPVAPIPPMAASADVAPGAAPAPPPAEIHAMSGVVLLSLDVDGDHHPEIVAPVERVVDGERAAHYAVFDARTGGERAHTPPLADLRSALIAGLGNRLVIASQNGQLTGYDLVSGDQQWTTTLGDRVSLVCAPREPGSLHVETADERKLTVDLTTGRQTETRDGCGDHVLAKGPTGDDPRDRRDHTAPPGVEAWLCGGVTVMGSANFRVPDACLARGHVDTDRLDGMVGHRIWQLGRGWLVIGVRKPGAYVPMVGRLERGSFLWKAEVPAANPLEAQEGGPRQVALIGDLLVAGYETGPHRNGVLTAFAVADGARRWTVSLPGDDGLDDLVTLDDAVVARTGEMLRVLALADGAVRATIGTAR